MTMPAPAHIRPDHDETLIARLAADDLTEREAADARTLDGLLPGLRRAPCRSALDHGRHGRPAGPPPDP